MTLVAFYLHLEGVQLICIKIQLFLRKHGKTIHSLDVYFEEMRYTTVFAVLAQKRIFSASYSSSIFDTPQNIELPIVFLECDQLP